MLYLINKINQLDTIIGLKKNGNMKIFILQDHFPFVHA